MSDEATINPYGGRADAMLLEMNLGRLELVMPILAEIDLEGIVSTVSAAHTFAPLLDPTAYRDALHRGHMDAIAEVSRALIPAVKVWREKVHPNIGIEKKTLRDELTKGVA